MFENRIQSKGHKIGTYIIKKKNVLSCFFNDKIFIQKNGYDGFARAY